MKKAPLRARFSMSARQVRESIDAANNTKGDSPIVLLDAKMRMS
jgi:hypothetical protein